MRDYLKAVEDKPSVWLKELYIQGEIEKGSNYAKENVLFMAEWLALYRADGKLKEGTVE